LSACAPKFRGFVPETTRESGAAPDGGGPARQRWRTIVATLLVVVVGCVLAPLSMVAVWSSNQEAPRKSVSASRA
jgi:predicted metalloprotease